MKEQILLMLSGVFTGWLFTYIYYRRGGAQLKKEASELRKLNILNLEIMEMKGEVKLSRDDNGKIVGWDRTVKVNKFYDRIKDDKF
jgi:hypothetical protein